jgi:hypothetical protein
MTEAQAKLEEAIKLLLEAEKAWVEKDIFYYPSSLPSFDELIAQLQTIEFK